ncbi:MAG: GDSL-type esterase/lipase family protein [Acidimicrobiales bacterium]|nr:GDSL-type esterase/lipase family protein [Acidimicrobiales bacterium]
MFRKYYKQCLIAYIYLFAACSSTETSFGDPSREEINTTTTRLIVKESIAQIAPIPTQTPTAIPDATFSLAESTPVSSLMVEEEIVVETTVIAAKSDSGEIAETEDLNSIKEIIRTPTKNQPLSVVTIGDSVSYDADLGIKAALESTEAVNVENRSFGGVGLTQKGFQSYLGESLQTEPEVMTVMVGGWDLAFATENHKEYEKIIENLIEEILKVSSLIIWIGMPPTPEAEGLEESRHLVNQIYKEISDRKREVEFIDTDQLLGNEKGAFVRFLTTFDGKSYQIRKVRDGQDDGHLCPFGAALIGGTVFERIAESFPLIQKEADWWFGEWSNDPRYDDPPGGCSYDPVT